MKLSVFMNALATNYPASTKPASRTPHYKNLIEDNTVNVYKTFSVEQAEITVYTNGYVTYSKKVDSKTRHTVFHINKINISYEFVDGTINKIDASLLGDTEEVNLLACYGEMRLAHNQESREEYHTDYHLNDDGNDWTKQANTDVDIVEKQIIDEPFNEQIRDANLNKLHNAMSKLTLKQREVIQKMYYEKKKTSKVAKELGIDRKTVKEHHESALKKLRKYF